MGGTRKKGKGALIAGLLLLGAGLLLILGRGVAAAAWLMRLWPVFLICAGLAAVLGFAISRRPRSPFSGLLLLVIGVLFLLGRFNSNLNVVQIYGRYWLLILAVFAGVELVRFYSHRPAEGPPPRLFTFWRLAIICLLVVTGVVANRVAKSNPSMLSAVRLPNFLNELRGSFMGETYTFSDPALDAGDLRPGALLTINNRYGNVRIAGGSPKLRITLTKGVPAWSEDEARKIAEQIRLVISNTSEGIEVGTNRDETAQQFTTNMEIEVPSSARLRITDSYGDVSVKGAAGDVSINASYGRAEIAGVKGNVGLVLTHSDADVSNVAGDVSISGVAAARVADVTGRVEVSGRNGMVDLRRLDGLVNVDAPLSKIIASGLKGAAEFRTEHASVEVSDATDVTVDAPHSDLAAENIRGSLGVSTSHGDIRLRSVEGDVTIRGQRSSLDAADLGGRVDIKTSNGEVTIKNFSDSVSVQTSYRGVTLIAPEELAGDIDVENNHGEIKLVVPPTSWFRLEATTTGGHVRTVGFSDLPPRTASYLSATLGSHGPTVKLRTSYRNITVQTPGVGQARTRPVVSNAPGIGVK